MRARRLFLLAASVLLAIPVLPAAAQVPREPDPPTGHGQPQGLPPGLQGMPQGAMPGLEPVPVVPDTAKVELLFADGSSRPTGLDFAPEPVGFGEIGALVVRYPIGQEAPVLANEPPADWLEYVPEVSREGLDRLEAAVATRPDGPGGQNTLLVPVRIYRADPFMLTAGKVSSPVIAVRGRTTDLSESAGIRPPRSRGWNLLVIAALAVSLVLFALLVWALWRRRTAPVAIEDWQPARPGWLAAAVRLQQLLESRDLEQGASREFLNGLAAVARGFVADRYGIAAREMTGPEIVEACRRRGHPLEPVRALARLIDEADRRRYDPEPVAAAWARGRTTELIDWIRKLRIELRQTPVAAAERLEADRAWTALQEFARHQEKPAPSTVTGEAN